MNGSTHPRRKPALLLNVLLGGLLLSICSSDGDPTENQMGELQNRIPSAVKEPPLMSSLAEAPAHDAGATFKGKTQPAQVPRSLRTSPLGASRPQLIKKAALTLVVNSLDKSIQQVSAIVKQQQGNLVGLEDQKPRNDSARHTVSMQIRVPQNQLDTTLDKLTQLGTNLMLINETAICCPLPLTPVHRATTLTYRDTPLASAFRLIWG